VAGREAFIASGCGACHAVRGTEANGTIGPELTHIGSRRLLAAGSFPNNAGTLAGWIADSQHLKPGNAMPSFSVLDGPTLRAIATWLASLR
jgi:cytochrome c oxidase subunit II